MTKINRRRRIAKRESDFNEVGLGRFETVKEKHDLRVSEENKKKAIRKGSNKSVKIAKQIRDWHEKVTLVMSGLLKVSAAETAKIKKWYKDVGSTGAWQRWMKNLEVSRQLHKHSIELPHTGEDNEFDDEERTDLSDLSIDELKKIAEEEGIDIEDLMNERF